MIDQDISKELALINTELSLLVRNSAANFIINVLMMPNGMIILTN